MTTSLVTGGAGFIGSHVAARLLQLGHKVVVMDDLSGGYRENVRKGARFSSSSITQPSRVDRLFKEHRFDYVYHLAAYAAENLSHHVAAYNYQTNLIGSVNIINACVNHHVKHLVACSSIAVYGDATPPFTTETLPHPIDPYGVAKLAMERHIETTLSKFGLPYTIFRPHNVMGPRQNYLDRYRNVVAIFFRQAMLGKPLTIFGDGAQTRAFTYITDVSEPIADAPMVAAHYCKTLNVGNEHAIPVIKLARTIINITGSKSKIEHLAERHEVKHAHSVNSLPLSFPAKHYLMHGLEETFKWMKTIPRKKLAATPPIFQGIEVARGLPPSWRK